MQFEFTEDQRLLQQTVRDFLVGECPVAFVRGQWEAPTGRSPEFWAKLAEVGVPGLLVPEAQGGLGMDEIDFVLVLIEIGRAGLAEPIVPTAVVGVPLLREAGERSAEAAKIANEWLPKVAAGEALLAVAQPSSPLVPDAHVADLLILRQGAALYAVPRAAVQLTEQKSNDPSQKLFTVAFDPKNGQVLASGAEADRLEAAALDRGALASAAQQLGACDQLIAMSVDYTSQRKQFGVPIGSFQALQHRAARVYMAIELARSSVMAAARSVDSEDAGDAEAAKLVSLAKARCCEAYGLATNEAVQIYGGVGMTDEYDVGFYMKRARAAELTFGDAAFHRRRWATLAGY